MHRNLGILILAAAAWGAAPAQTIYRCGDSYSQQPCPGGAVVAADDARSASQGAQTREAAQRDAKRADAMEKARMKDEAKPAQALIFPGPKKEEPPPKGNNGKLAKGKKPAEFTAVAPQQPGEKKKPKKKAAG